MTLGRPYSIGKNRVLLAAVGGAPLAGEVPVYRAFEISGIRSFPGLQTGQLRGESYWLATAIFSRKLADVQSLIGQAIYGGLRVQAVEMRGRLDAQPDKIIYE